MKIRVIVYLLATQNSQSAAWYPDHNNGSGDGDMSEHVENSMIAADRLCDFLDIDSSAIIEDLPVADQEAVFLAGSLFAANILNRFLPIEVLKEDFKKMFLLLKGAVPAVAEKEEPLDES